jgi:hypothetical protein
MAIKPHCVVCGFDSDAAGSVQFADYHPGWQAPTGRDGAPIIGWSNQLGVTAPPGVGLFCERHLRPARRLRRLPSAEAVGLLQAGSRGWWAGLRGRFTRRR